ncbi:MAG TPA: hypothetical protein VLL05_11915, partial [Terriglobales bacterium]|nr:hypothetical protein [Terriglobales bacterium]
MTWANFYLICFVVGFAFSLISFLSGGTRWHFHLPHTGGHLPIAGHVPVAGHGPSIGGAHGPGLHASAASAANGASQAANDISISPFNFVTFTAFLAWFGGTGYLLTRYSGLWFV